MKKPYINILYLDVSNIKENYISTIYANCFNHKLKNMYNYKKMENLKTNLPKKLIAVDLLHSIINTSLGEKHGQN